MCKSRCRLGGWKKTWRRCCR